MNKITITQDELLDTLFKTVYKRRLCPSQQIYGIAASMWKFLQTFQQSVEAVEDVTLPLPGKMTMQR